MLDLLRNQPSSLQQPTIGAYHSAECNKLDVGGVFVSVERDILEALQRGAASWPLLSYCCERAIDVSDCDSDLGSQDSS